MSDTGKENLASTQEQQYLRRSLRRIIIGQELGPRTPRWRAAWKRTLLNYADRLGQLNAKSNEVDQAT